MIKLHHCPQTRSMRSLWLLHELGVEFEVQEHRFDKSLRHADYLDVSAAGRVPALELDGARLFETGAITQALCERFSPDGLGRGVGHSERAEWLVWVHFAETISQHTAALTQQHVALREDHMRSPIVMKLETARLGKCYDAIEAHLRKVGTAALLPGGFSAADISVGQAVYMSRYFTSLLRHPLVSAWYTEITARDGFQKALPAPGSGIYTQDFYPAWAMP